MDTLPFEMYVFDWSGTLSDDRQPIYRSNQLLLAHFNKPAVSYEDFYANIKGNVFDFYEEQGITGDPDALFALFKHYLNETVASGIKPVLYTDANAVLTHLQMHGARMGVVSSHPQENLEREMEENDVRNFFDFVIGNCRDKTETLRSVAAKASTPEKTVYTGDTTHDIRAAKGADMCSAGISTGYHTYEMLQQEQPHFLLRTLSDLKNVLVI